MRNHVVVVVGARVKSWAIGLEMACTLAKAGKQVTVLDFSDFEKHWPFSLGRTFTQFKMSSQNKFKIQKVRRKESPLPMASFSEINSLNDLSELKYQGYAIGDVILASIYAKFGSSSLDLSRIEKDEVRETVALVVDILYSVLQLQVLNDIFLEEVIVFNGREPIEACCLLLAKQMNVSTRISERASSSDKYCLYMQSPHTNSEWWDNIWKFDNSVKTGKILLSDEKIQAYKSQKSSGFDPFQRIKWRDFMDPNERYELPSTRYVMFYSVSTGEKSPFAEFETKLGFPDQFKALEALLEAAQALNLTVVIRRHPNSLGVDGVDRESALWFKYQNRVGVVYIGPRERVDSYVLATSAYCCFTWRSTIGFDTLCLGIPTYSLGPSKWALDQSLRAWDKERLTQVLESPELPDQALVDLYASYMSHFGENLRFFQKVERWGFISNSGKRVSNFLFQRLFNILGHWGPRN